MNSSLMKYHIPRIKGYDKHTYYCVLYKVIDDYSVELCLSSKCKDCIYVREQRVLENYE